MCKAPKTIANLAARRGLRVDATIVECFRAWEDPLRNRHPWFEIVADIKTPDGRAERVSARQKLNSRTLHWRPPDPSEIVPARWDPAYRKLRLDLSGDPLFDERVVKKLGRTRHPPPPFSPGGGPGRLAAAPAFGVVQLAGETSASPSSFAAMRRHRTATIVLFSRTIQSGNPIGSALPRSATPP
jgi:hypothetical protein